MCIRDRRRVHGSDNSSGLMEIMNSFSESPALPSIPPLLPLSSSSSEFLSQAFLEQSQIEEAENPEASLNPVSYTHLRAHETSLHLVCRLLLEKKKTNTLSGIS
eukprot:TRINITY_DN11192_c0_g1_i2.p1 TRINITY_DN11192_c0_g1~~TRINITY_DN11192_c0_g1_i2.p1  ORF type:complete len:104 (-),score=30.19 TRINITY_DN11192_c0_g1_i2:110-421(-)